jgi:hypothetical protein
MNLPNKPKVLAATYNPVSNTRMISFLVEFPTALLAELRTHRVIDDLDSEPIYAYNAKVLDDFNLSANSARAIPVNKYIEKIENNPHEWIWTSKKAGMSGGEVTDNQVEIFNKIQKEKLEFNIQKTNELIEAGCHKQQANRGLSEFAYTTCIISGTEWDNFFVLRCPKYEYEGIVYNSMKELYKQYPNNLTFDEITNQSSAQPEFQVIAELLYDLYKETEWSMDVYHIPFKSKIEELYGSELLKYTSNDKDYLDKLMLVSASMCAKLSYNTQDAEDNLDKHLERVNMLIEHKHWEPFSHQSVRMHEDEHQLFFKQKLISNQEFDIRIHEGLYGDKVIVRELGWCHNLRGFISQRFMLENW